VSDCAVCRELLGGYVLGALGPDEVAVVERHMETCPRCGREYGELAALPALLDLAGSAEAELEAPPAELEEAVLDRFARERRGVAPPARRPRRALRVGAALAAAALAVAVTLVVSGVFSSSDESFGSVHMARGGDTAEADLKAVRAGTEVRLTVHAPSWRPDWTYELWCIPDKGPWISGGSFRVDQSGRANVELTSAARPGDYERMLVTRPAGDDRKVVLAGHVEY
jgi:Anti-sigma-K factor rskA/Putative zinc-finger